MVLRIGLKTCDLYLKDHFDCCAGMDYRRLRVKVEWPVIQVSDSLR